MTHAVANPAIVTAPSFGRLYAVEIRRFFARRVIKALLILLLIGYLIAIGTVWHERRKVTAGDRAAAVAERDFQFKQSQQNYTQCIKTTPADQVEDQCGSQPDLADYQAGDYLRVRPLTPDAVSTVAISLGVGVAAIGFLAAATFIGAEWSSRNIVAWLFWEPRRLRLLAAKVLAMLSVMLAVSALVQLSWAGIGRVLLHYRGTPISALGPKAGRFSADLLRLQVRAAVLVLAFALLAFCIAHLLRNTAAALGFGFLYFAVLENAVRILRPRWSPYLLTDNTGAWLNTGGVRVDLGDKFDPRTGDYIENVAHVGNARAALTIGIYVAVAVVLAVASFRRRDIT